jgi:enamine deaminase RidA (YjgF/YER057c/UK114 family)
MSLSHVNPRELATSPVFSQGVASSRAGLLFVGGQNGHDATGVMAEGFAAQTEQAYRNVLAVLTAAGCSTTDVLKLTIYIRGDEDVVDGLEAAQRVWGSDPTAISVLRVHGLARPDALVEIEAVAELPSVQEEIAS